MSGLRAFSEAAFFTQLLLVFSKTWEFRSTTTVGLLIEIVNRASVARISRALEGSGEKRGVFFGEFWFALSEIDKLVGSLESS